MKGTYLFRHNKNGFEQDACHHYLVYLMEFAIAFIPKRTELRIPPHVLVDLPEYVTLRDRYRNTWQVKARKVDGHWYLLDGWANFVADSSVTVMDVLWFNYSGPGLFDVDIFESNGVLKEGVGYKICNPKEDCSMDFEEADTFEKVSSDNPHKDGEGDDESHGRN